MILVGGGGLSPHYQLFKNNNIHYEKKKKQSFKESEKQLFPYVNKRAYIPLSLKKGRAP